MLDLLNLLQKKNIPYTKMSNTVYILCENLNVKILNFIEKNYWFKYSYDSHDNKYIHIVK